jgi:hypothetical protein
MIPFKVFKKKIMQDVLGRHGHISAAPILKPPEIEGVEGTGNGIVKSGNIKIVSRFCGPTIMNTIISFGYSRHYFKSWKPFRDKPGIPSKIDVIKNVVFDGMIPAINQETPGDIIDRDSHTFFKKLVDIRSRILESMEAYNSLSNEKRNRLIGCWIDEVENLICFEQETMNMNRMKVIFVLLLLLKGWELDVCSILFNIGTKHLKEDNLTWELVHKDGFDTMCRQQTLNSMEINENDISYNLKELFQPRTPYRLVVRAIDFDHAHFPYFPCPYSGDYLNSDLVEKMITWGDPLSQLAAAHYIPVKGLIRLQSERKLRHLYPQVKEYLKKCEVKLPNGLLNRKNELQQNLKEFRKKI